MPIEKSRLGQMTSRTDIPKNLNKACLVCWVRAFYLTFLEPRKRVKTENIERDCKTWRGNQKPKSRKQSAKRGLDANSKAGTIGTINQKQKSQIWQARSTFYLAASNMMALLPFFTASNPNPNPLVSKFNFFFFFPCGLSQCSVSYNFV